MDSEVVGSAEISALIVHSCSHAVAAWPRWVFRGYPFVMIFLAWVITRVPPDSRGDTCPWQFPAAKLVLPEKEHSSIIKFLTPTITRGPDPCASGPVFLQHPVPLPVLDPPVRPSSPPHLGSFAAPARCRDSPRKVEKSGQEKRLHYKSDSSAISSIFASSSGSTSPSSSEFDAMNWAAHCKSSFVRNSLLLVRSAKVTR